MTDDIMKELWEIKDANAREHGNDPKSLIARLRTLKTQSTASVVDRSTAKGATIAAQAVPIPNPVREAS